MSSRDLIMPIVFSMAFHRDHCETFRLFKIWLQESLLKPVAGLTSHLFSKSCIGYQFSTELSAKYGPSHSDIRSNSWPCSQLHHWSHPHWAATKVVTLCSWIPCKLVIPSRFVSWKTHFLMSVGSASYQIWLGREWNSCASELLLTHARSQLVSFVDRSFQLASAAEWNSLP